jgi:hypothetical protein
MLNDTVFNEAAQSLARQVVAHSSALDERIELLVRRCLTRQPTEAERELLRSFYGRQRERLAKGELKAADIVGAGAADAADLAAWALTARAVLNLDEAIVKE